jgi:hypothetical protein
VVAVNCLPSDIANCAAHCCLLPPDLQLPEAVRVVVSSSSMVLTSGGYACRPQRIRQQDCHVRREWGAYGRAGCVVWARPHGRCCSCGQKPPPASWAQVRSRRASTDLPGQCQALLHPSSCGHSLYICVFLLPTLADSAKDVQLIYDSLTTNHAQLLESVVYMHTVCGHSGSYRLSVDAGTGVTSRMRAQMTTVVRH